MRNKKEEKRRFCRFPTTLKGLYFLEEKEGEGKECTIINISLNGAGLEFYTIETVSVNSKIFLEILLSDRKETVNVAGTIRWVKQGREDCVCGIQLTEKLNEDKKAMLGI
jgi:hypothetical protein